MATPACDCIKYGSPLVESDLMKYATKPDASIKNLNPTPVKAVKGKIDYIATN